MKDVNDFCTSLPATNSDARKSLYDGKIFLISSNKATEEFVAAVLEVVIEALGDNFRECHKAFSNDEFFSRVGRIRKAVYASGEFHKYVNRVIESLGFDLQNQAYDPARMRVVSHDGHLNPAAAPVYFGHRDTWYSNHQAMLTWWIPLHDVFAEETFEFYPDYFAKHVENDSEIFDFDSWVSGGQEKRIGWQKKDTGKTATYPSLKEKVSGQKIPVVANAGDVLLFSGQHLHQTLPNVTGQTRFSLDFRTVDLNDVENKIEAVNVDNRSTGSSLVQFIRPCSVPQS